jgi:hypothetical protein
MKIHQATTPKNKAIAAGPIQRRRERKNAKIAKAANVPANTTRSQGQGKFE